MRIVLLLVLIMPWVASADTGPSTGLPLPRFVSLRSDEVNVRTGPGLRYPIEWVFRRKGLPVEITDEFDYWRKIRDMEGSGGWVHKSMLSGERTVMIRGTEAAVLREEPVSDAIPVLKAAPMVIGQVLECRKDWCRLRIAGEKGWLAKSQIWGVYSVEIFH